MGGDAVLFDDQDPILKSWMIDSVTDHFWVGVCFPGNRLLRRVLSSFGPFGVLTACCESGLPPFRILDEEDLIAISCVALASNGGF